MRSMGLLQEDSAETSRNILLVISRQLANNSIPAFEPSPFKPKPWAVRVNGFFFMSIICSLVVALFAVLTRQWIANYEVGLSTASPNKRATQHQLRHMGRKKWNINSVIPLLQLLIFISLFLFFIGIADWLWHINRKISAIVMTGTVVGAVIYFGTTIISIIWIDSPFRTPISKSLAVTIRQALVWLKAAVIRLPSLMYRGNRISSLSHL
jgi:hypothetical protein